MADIKNYLKEREKREQNREDYRSKILKHRMRAVYRILLVVLILGILITFVWVQYRKHVYTSYDIVSSQEREALSGTTDIRLGDAILTYSKDGAHCTDLKGNVLWDQTYEIQDVLLDICRDVAVIAEYNGQNVYVVSAAKQLGSFSTTMPIRNVTVAASGRVTVVMTDTNVTYYNTYSPTGELLYKGQATMSSSGYPVSVSLSPNGELLQISYIYLETGVQKTNVAFYNLGPVGANETDYLVSVHTYKDIFVPYVQFMNDDTAFAVGDSRLMIYKGDQKPVMLAEFNYTDEVQSVFYSEEYIGLVFYSNTGNSLYKMNVYSAGGEMVGAYYFDIEYSDLFFGENGFTVYNSSQCVIMTLDQVVKFEGSFEKNVRRMIPLRSAYKYLLVTNDTLDTIQLK